ncbi:hypothetical protein LTS09_016106 [Friedmanniomyces endolithicus]|nr:hypothetical protein LTS09_016106 [Friedmanniomyces endolithicus]
MGDQRRDAEATHPILKTWQISFDYVRERRRTAAKLLSMMSFCDRQAIPASLLRIKEDGGEYNGEQHPDDTFEDDIEMLLGLSFISLSADGSAFDMHRLALVATRRWLKNRGNQEEQVKRLLAKLDAVFPLGQARELGHGSKLAEAIEVGERSWQVTKTTLGADHPDTLVSVSTLAWYYDRLRDSRRAAEMEEACWQMRSDKLGPDHPHTLVSMSTLAGYYDRLGDAAAPPRRNTIVNQE